MKTIIYYFTGTGNSLAAARKISALLGDCELVPVASLENFEGEVIPSAECIGIIFPVYDFGLPAIVADFAGRIDISRVRYSFCIITSGGMGKSALHQLNSIVTKKNGRPFDAGWEIHMVGNFVPLYSPMGGKKLEKRLAAADERIRQISRLIESRTPAPPGITPVSSLLKLVMYGPLMNKIRQGAVDGSFSVDENCTSCGTCMKVCPVRNIEMTDGKPRWQHHCEFCLGCLNYCPSGAIQWGQRTRGRRRYHHPEIKIADMKAQQGEQTLHREKKGFSP